jgi:hypothetical protein
MEYRYDIRQFNWNPDTNSFYADAPYLECIANGIPHQHAFPSMKGEFWVDNLSTGKSRKFTFVEEKTFEEFDGMYYVSGTEWTFICDDGIRCFISF